MCPENPLQNGFSFLTEWFILVPKKIFLQQKMAKPSQTHCLLQNGIPQPHFFPQNGGLYEGQPHPFCGGNGKEVGRTAFCRKGLRPTIETCFVRKSCAGRFKIAILQLQFSTIEPHFVRNGCDRHFQFAIFL